VGQSKTGGCEAIKKSLELAAIQHLTEWVNGIAD
jgi:hypothetical protein